MVAEVNAELIAQALVNLADNALRHTPPGTCIRIEAAQTQDGVCLTVSDNGPGIPVEERTKVTRRFYRLDRSRNRPGTGLGLSLVAAIARLHGGQLDLSDNRPGLRACVELPSRKGI